MPNAVKIMAILNITPDSFSDGGKFDTAEAALKQAQKCIAEGADILDIGAESTRPGADEVNAEAEIARLMPVLEAFQGAITKPISIDTYKADVASAALEKGVSIVNDVWGLQRDSEIANVAAHYDCPTIIMHNRFAGADGSIDILDDMDRWFDTSLSIAHKAGIADKNIILDPGIGFGKTYDQNFPCLANLSRLKAKGYPVLMGLSRKSFIGKLLDVEVNERQNGTLAANLDAVARGADIIRVHDILPHKQALTMLAAIESAKQ